MTHVTPPPLHVLPWSQSLLTRWLQTFGGTDLALRGTLCGITMTKNSIVSSHIYGIGDITRD